MEEVIEPVLSIGFSIILAIILGGVAYVFLDILGKELATRHPFLLSLQFAGMTTAVASAPQKAVFCHRLHPAVNMEVGWAKRETGGMGVILTRVTESGSVAEAVGGSGNIYVGPMPQPYPVRAYFEIRKSDPFTVAIQKNETGLYVFEVDDLSECEPLV